MYVVSQAYFDLEQERLSQRTANETLHEVQLAKLDLNRLLVTSDLVFGDQLKINTYLIQPLIIQIHQFGKRLKKLENTQKTLQKDLVLIDFKLKQLNLFFLDLLNKPTVDKYNEYENLSFLITKNFQDVLKFFENSYKNNNQSLIQKQTGLLETAAYSVITYIILIILILFTGNRSIAYPISLLYHSAKRSLDNSEQFTVDTRLGPTEIRLLADMLSNLINHLESEVSKKTIDLENENIVRREAEKVLLDLTAQQAPLVEAWNQMTEAVEILNSQGDILFVNPAYLKLNQIENAEDVLLKPSQLIELGVWEELLFEAQKGLPWSNEIELKVNQRVQIYEIQSSPVVYENDELSQVIVIQRDITKQRLAQASASHNDRLAAIGTLAAGMAHEINNPLTYIKMSLDLVKDELENLNNQQDKVIWDPKQGRELLEAISDASEGVNRVALIVQSLLNVARKGANKGSSEQIRAINILETFQTCTNLVKADMSQKVALELNIREDLIIWGRRSELIQVFLNFLMNAVQAIPPKQNDKWIKVYAECADPFINITIQDNGQGISPEDLSQVFDPFFSSKPIGEGTGLGLSVSKSIIQAHQGKIQVTSQVGLGTSFVISLPMNETVLPKMISQNLNTPPAEINNDSLTVNEEQSQQNKANQPAVKLDLSNSKVLIVDDDILVSKSFKTMLNSYDVTVTNNSVEALELCCVQAFDLVLSDVMMPDLNGLEFYQKISEEKPRYLERFIFITGATKKAQLMQELSETQCPILKKPISKSDLLRVVQAKLMT